MEQNIYLKGWIFMEDKWCTKKKKTQNIRVILNIQIWVYLGFSELWEEDKIICIFNAEK